MDKHALKDITYGALAEIFKDKRLYYYSSVGPGYSHLTEEGEKVIVECINLLAYRIIESDEEDINKRAKELTMKALKGESI